MSQAIAVIACLALFLVPPIFVTHKVYKDGVFGRAGLLGISFGAAVFLGEFWLGSAPYLPPIAVWLIAFMAVFICWHLIRFHLRVLRKPPIQDVS